MKFSLTSNQYTQIESKIALTDGEDYAVTVQKRRGKATYGIHVFTRQPSTKELVEYEETSSRVKYKGSQAELVGSPLVAAKKLYGVLIARAYDIQVGPVLEKTLNREQAVAKVPDFAKREAIREFLGNVSGLTSLASADGDDEPTGQFSEE